MTLRRREATRDDLLDLLEDETGVLRVHLSDVLDTIESHGGRVVDVKVEVEEEVE